MRYITIIALALVMGCASTPDAAQREFDAARALIDRLIAEYESRSGDNDVDPAPPPAPEPPAAPLPSPPDDNSGCGERPNIAYQPQGGAAYLQKIGGGFLWKPKSESGPGLVVILPSSLRGNIVSCNVYLAATLNKVDGTVEAHDKRPFAEWVPSAKGKFRTDEANGCRPHYFFALPGKEYGNCYVLVQTRDGRALAWEIRDGAKRYD